MTEIHAVSATLVSLYNEENLKKISTEIIGAYRKNNKTLLLRYAANLDIPENEFKDNPTGSFRKMMLFYHPDRRKIIHKTIERLTARGMTAQLEKLKRYISCDFIQPPQPVPSPGFCEREQSEAEPFSSNPFNDDFLDEDFIHTSKDTTRVRIFDAYEFLEAVRALMYGNLPGDFLPKDLYHLDGELNLSEEGIGDLSGVEYCINITELILSGNRISNLTDLSGLTQLTSLDLSRNDISDIDGLMSLASLQYLDLSFNAIEDINPLANLSDLRFVNLIGNPVRSEKVIAFLKNNGTIVLTDL